MSDRLEQVQRAFSAYLIERELGSGGMATSKAFARMQGVGPGTFRRKERVAHRPSP